MSVAELFPPDGEPRAWVVAHARAQTLKVFTGESALRDAENFIGHQPEHLVESGYFGLDYGEYRRCCGEYLSPEADCTHLPEEAIA